jgi:signal transduction histidine kinase
MKFARSVRGRATLGAATTVFAALILGGLLFNWALVRAVEQSAAVGAEASAERNAAHVGADGSGLGDDFDDDELVQIQTPDGQVLAASDEARELPPMTAGRSTIDNDPFIVVEEGVKNSRLTVVVGHEIEDGLKAVAAARWLLATAIPPLVALVALGAWILTGRALAPVTRIRGEVEAIEVSRLHQRLDVPDTGDEIAQLASTMNHMLNRLDAASRAQRQFVSNASHELRSPLATIRQHAEVAALHPGSVPVDELTGVVLSEGERLQSLVDALLLLARLDEGVKPAFQAVDLDDIVLAEVHRARTDAIVVDGSAISAARVQGDPQLLSHVVRNLVDNAVRHAQARVTVSLRTVQGDAQLVVDDDGLGVPPKSRATIFDRFSRLDEGRARDHGGAGLGLAIVRGIVEAHGGSVDIDDAPGGGARFVVRLPPDAS